MLNISCKLGYHKLYIVKTFYPGCRKVYCTRCKKYFGMNDAVQTFLPWDIELEEYSKMWSK
jgi:hypothetical protein